jgi:hypothetical protein
MFRPSHLVVALALILIVGVSASAQGPPVPDRVRTIVFALYNEHTDLAKGDDDARRSLTKMIAEQIVYEFPADGWGWKSASPTRPPSKDCFARRGPGYFVCYDWQNGTTRAPRWPFITNDITGQHWIDVTGRNHLGTDSPDLPDPPDPPVDEALVKRVAALEQLVASQGAALVELSERLGALVARVTALEQAPPPAGGPVTTCVDVVVATSREWGHGHKLTVPVCKPQEPRP